MMTMTTNYNYPPAFWKRVAGLTEDYCFVSNNHGNFIGTINIDFINFKKLPLGIKQFLESFIYQAIDGINNPLGKLYLYEDPEKITAGTEKAYKYFLFIAFKSKTETRLAALYWIFEQEEKAKIKE